MHRREVVLSSLVGSATLIALYLMRASSGGGAPNLYSIYETAGEEGYANTTGRTTESAALVGGEATGIFIILGQSLTANNGASNYTPTNAEKSQEISIFDGLCYRLKDPALGASGGTGGYISRLADALITAGLFQRVIMIPCGVGGSSVLRWTPAGDLNHKLRVAYLRARSLGYTVSGVLWGQGEADVQAGTSKATYKARFDEMADSIRALGCTAPWFVAQETYLSGVTNSTIRDAQSELVGTRTLPSGNSITVYAGPDLDTLGGANRQGDDIHLSDTGNANAAAAWVTKLDIVF